MSVTLRPCHSEDTEFLYEVYASTREEEMALVDWDPKQKEDFLRMQFNAQHTFYHENFSECDYQVIMDGERPIGRYYVDRRPDELRIVDIALLPSHRNTGIGSTLMKELLEEATAAGKPVRIHVEIFNPALALYRRLGFEDIEENGVYLLMEYTPNKLRASVETAKGQKP